MKIRLNGEEYDTKAGTVSSLLEEIDIVPERVAVELNLKIIKKDKYDRTDIKEGDEIEVVSFVGGGCIKKR
ncbi:MAG: sulfur carrier protein ThiS [Thermodesulfovibrionales bacterium]